MATAIVVSDDEWHYDKSVEFMRPLVVRWKRDSVDMLRELHRAREALSRDPADGRPRKSGTDVPLSWSQYCEDVGLVKRTANRWLTDYDPVADRLIESPDTIVTRFTGNQENYTPQHIISSVRTVLGEIDLDPASCERAQEVVRAAECFDAEDNGLTRPWHGRVFLNPPYQMPLIREFTDKLLSELPNIETAILLTNNNTDTQWFHAAAAKSAAVCFTAGRIQFYTEEKVRTQPTNGQAFFYFGAEPYRFVDVFSGVGMVMRRWGGD